MSLLITLGSRQRCLAPVMIADTQSGSGGLAEMSLPVADLVIENFATSDLTPAGTSPDFNYNNLFTWDNPYRSFVGTDIDGVATKLRPGTSRTFPGKNFVGLVAPNSLGFAFQYPDWPMAEQRFSLNAHYAEVWFRYLIKIPENFHHGDFNNKLAAFWTANYDSAGDVTFQTRPAGSSGSCKLVVQDGGAGVPEVDCYEDFIDKTRDSGRWMQIVFRLVAATSGANGVIQAWRRWSNENTWTQLYSKMNATFSEGGQGIHQGYLFGSAENGPYTDPNETVFLVQRFEVSRMGLI